MTPVQKAYVPGNKPPKKPLKAAVTKRSAGRCKAASVINKER